METEEGKIMFCIVREFLEFFNLDCTLSVYEPESYLGKIYEYQGRHTVAEKLGLGGIEGDSHVPLLLSLIKYVQLKKNESLQADGLLVSKDTSTTEGNDSKSTTKFNCTYDLSNPTINLCITNNEIDETSPSKEVNITEKSPTHINSVLLNNKLQEAEIGLETTLKDTRINNKPKLDKNKTKAALSDTSPLQNNKSRVSDILPSLYNKEYKDKSGVGELDKIFDMNIEYEEDLMISENIPLHCDHLKTNSNNLLRSNNLKSISADSTEILSKLLSNSAELGDPSFQKDHSNNVKQ